MASNTYNLNTWSAKLADRLTGFSSRSAAMSWGNQTGAVVTCLGTSSGGAWGFRDNNPTNGQVSMTIDGTIYIKEGGSNVGNAIKSITRSGLVYTLTDLWGNTSTVTQQDNASASYTKTITVTGDADTYYPVVISTTTDKTKPHIISIWKNLGSATATYSGNHSNGTSSMWLMYEYRNMYWDGNGGYYKTWYYSMPYAPLVAKSQALGSGVGSLCVWLRGGGTAYNVSADYDLSVTAYYAETTNLGSATYPVNVAPVTTVTTKGWVLSSTLGYGNIDGNATTASTWQTSRTLTIGATGKSVNGSANVTWSKDEILGASTSANFLRGDKSWTNALEGNLTITTGGIWVQGGSAAGSNNSRMTLTSGMPTGLQYNSNQRGVRIYSNAIAFADPYNGNGNNDSGWLRHIEETANSGVLELAVGDDGSEQIVARQYNTSSAIVRTLTLLDGSGNTTVPGILAAQNDVKFIAHGNEFNYVQTLTANMEVHINHRQTGGNNTGGFKITKYHFKDGAGGLLGTISSGQFSGNANTATTLATARTLWGQSFNGSTNITGSMTDVGPDFKLPASQTAFQFLTSGSGAANGKFGRILLSDNYGQGDITNYRFYVNGGSSYFNGSVLINGTTTSYGPLRIGNSDAAANTGYATANVGANNYITFYGVYGDAPGSYSHTYIGESIYGSKTAANEQSELLLFHGNDPAASSGPDRIRLFAGQVDIQVYTSALSGTWDAIRGTTGTQVANFANGLVTISGQLHVNNSQDVGLNQAGALIIGPKAGTNIGIDDNEIMARNNSAASTLYLNNEGGLIQTGSGGIVTSGSLAVGQTTGTGGYGLSLYGGVGYVKNYGILFATTATLGTHGMVSSDWATYFTMDGATSRGWIFRHTSGNVASISATGNIQTNGNIYIGSSRAGGYLNGAATNGGINSILIGDDVWLGDCNSGGIMGMKSTGANCGFYFYNNSGTNIGQLYAYNNEDIYSSKPLRAPSTASSWLDGQRYKRGAYNLTDATDTGSYWPWFRQTNTSSSYWFSFGILNTSFYLIGSTTSRTTNGYDYGLQFNLSNGYLQGASRVYSAVWNDIAEFREGDITEGGWAVADNGKGKMILTTERMQPASRLTSDTYGQIIGQSDTAKTPVSIGGRVLAYPYQDRNNYKVGDAVCAAPGGKIDIMTREEIKEFPDRIIGIVSEIPEYETWEQVLTNEGGGGRATATVPVQERIWVYIR